MNITSEYLENKYGKNQSRSTSKKGTITSEYLEKNAPTIYRNMLQEEYNSVINDISGADKWSSPEQMETYIHRVKRQANSTPELSDVYGEVLSALQEKKKVYEKFNSRLEYDMAVARSPYQNLTYDQVKEELKKQGPIEFKPGTINFDSKEYLKNYGMTVGYSDSESYGQEIAALDAEIATLKKDIDSAHNIVVSPGDRGPEQNTAWENLENNQKDETELRKKLEELEVKRAYFERKQKEVGAEELFEQKYKPVKQAADFEQKAVPNKKIDDAFYQLANGTGFDGTDYEYFSAQDDLALFDEFKEDEKKVYLYLADPQNMEAARKYFDDMRPLLNARRNETQTKRNKEFSDKVPGLSDILTLGSQLIDGTIMAPKKFIGSLTGDYEKNWASYDSLTTFTNTIRTDRAQDLNKIAGGEWAGFLYNTVMSIADMGTALAVGGAAGKIVGSASSAANTTNIAKGVTQFIMSSEAASQTMTDARQRGLSGIQIAALGVASGTIEALTEKLPLDNLFGAKPSYVKAVVKQIATEGTEEAISNVANTILDEIIAGNQSALKQQIADYMADGMSYKDAANKVLIDKVKEIGMDALAGALSGAIMGGGSVALNKLSTVHFSIPTKYKGDLLSAQTWVADKFQNLKSSVNKKGLGTVVVDSQTMTDAIQKTETADQALTFAAINDIIHKGKVKLDGNAAAIGTVATLNGNTHSVVLTASKMNNGNFWITGITMDGDAVLYDARDYLQQMAQSASEQDTAEQDEISAKLVDGQDSGFDYDSLNRITQTSGQQAPVSEAAPTVPAAQGNVAAMDNGVANQTPAYEQQNSAAVEGDAIGAYENEKIDYSILELEQTELDVSFLEMNEEERADFAQRFESATGTRVVFDETISAGGKYKDGVITVDPNKDTPMTVLIHELTHHIENHPKYADFFEYVFKSEMFASWLKEKGTTLQDMRRATIALRAEKGRPLGASGDVTYEADQEILGYFLGQKVFRNMDTLADLAKKHRNIVEVIRDFFANIIRYFRSTPMERELQKIEQMFSKVVQSVKPATDTVDGSAKYSIEYDALGNKVVVIGNGQNIFWGADEVDFPKIARAYINDTFKGISLPLSEHNIVTPENTGVQKYVYSGKPIDFATQRAKMKAATELDNLLKVSEFVGHSPDGKNHSFAKDGFDYYKTTFMVDGQVFEGIIDIGINGNKQTFYGMTNIKRVTSDIGRYSNLLLGYNSELSSRGNSFDTNVPQKGTDVNTQYMQDGEKYSVSPVLDAEETAQEQSNLSETREQTTVEQATDELLFEEIRRRHPQLSPIDIARLKPEDAVTTPTIKNSTVRNVTDDGDSSFYDSLQNADIFNDELKTLAASNSTIMQYDRIGNKETLRDANEEINRKGRRYVGEFLNKKSTEFTAKDVAAGFILMGRYNAVGDYRGAVMIAEKLREVGTKSGQTVQAFSILGRLTPEGMQLYAQRELHKAYETMLKEQTNKWGRENKDKFKLTDEDIEFIRRKVVQAAQLPDGRDKYVRLAEIAARIQSKIPQQKGQSFKALQRTAMLLNPKTQIRNITGNLFAMPQFIVSDFIGTGLDKMISKSTGVRTKAGVHLSAKAFAEGLFNSWNDFVRHINTRNFENGRFEIEGHSFDNFSDRNAFTRALNKLDRINSFLLDAGDRSFYQMWFINSLNGQMKANHVTEPTAAMIEIATDEALERTWQDDNKVSKSVSGLKRIMNNIHIGSYGLGDVVIKFSKTPANLTKAIFDFSPAGLVKALSADAYKFSQAVRDGKATPQMQRTFVKNLSNGITGTLMTFIAMAVAKAGLLTGDKDEDKDVADFEKYVKGHQPYSVKIGNSSFTYDWAQPTAALMAIAADYFENKQNEELTGEAKGFVQNIIDAIQVGGQVLYNQSFMKSIQNLFGNDGFWSGLIDTIIQDPIAMFPQAFSQIAAVTDPVIRNTYENGREVKTAVNKALYKIPGARNTLAESVDVMGNTKMQHGSVWNRIFNNFLNPANVAKGYDSAAADEVYRLYQVTGDASVIPSQAPNYVEIPNGGKRTLSSHEKADYQKATGKMITEAVVKLLANERYRGLSDDTKVELLGKVYSYSKQSANSEVLSIEMNESAIKAHDVISQGIPLYEYFLLKQVADENDNGAISQEEARAALDASGLTKTQKSIMWKAFNSGWKSNPYGKRYY